MRTYWDNFIGKYGEQILRVNTYTLLNAFWLYCNSYEYEENERECDKLMGYKQEKNRKP